MLDKQEGFFNNSKEREIIKDIAASGGYGAGAAISATMSWLFVEHFKVIWNTTPEETPAREIVATAVAVPVFAGIALALLLLSMYHFGSGVAKCSQFNDAIDDAERGHLLPER